MTTGGLFPRQLRLLIEDEEGAGVDLGKLSVRFDISYSGQGIGLAKIGVHNLSTSTIAKLMEKKYKRVRLDAGYPQRFGTIFNGEIRNVYPVREGADRLTDIYAADGAGDYEQATCNLSFAAGVTLHSVLTQLAGTFSKVAIGSLGFVTDQTISGSFVASGMTRDELNKLALSFGFRWWIQGGVLQFIDRGRTDGQPAIEISRETGMIDSPLASTIGVEVLTLLDHRLVPGRRIDVFSAGAQVTTSTPTLAVGGLGPANTSEFLGFGVWRVVHVGESRGQAWYTKALALPAGAL
jgi:hypothetical protein